MTDDQIARREDTTPTAVALRIRALMSVAGLGTTDYGRALGGVHRATVQSWVYGRSTPRREQLLQICRREGVNADFILFGDWRTLSAETWAKLRSALCDDAEIWGRDLSV